MTYKTASCVYMQFPNTYIKPNILPQKLQCFLLPAMPDVVIPINQKYHTVLAEKTPTCLTIAIWSINVSMHRMNVIKFLLNMRNVTENGTLFIST
jgi:hypothetical protein